MINIVIFGKNGQVGSALCDQFKKYNNFNIRSFSSQDVDFSDLDSLDNFLNNLTTTNFIINAAAYTNVNKAEEERNLANIINHKAVEILANYCAKNNVSLIHYSTDYVFDGSGNKPFKEDNKKNLNPLNYYGRTKLDGEIAIINSGCNYIILRTSWVWNDHGKNFVNTIRKLAKEREEINVIDDQIGSPTSAYYIASNTIKIINRIFKIKNSPKTIYHLVEEQYMSWYDFALKIVKNLKDNNEKLLVKKINPIKTSDYKTVAKRPLNSRLDRSNLLKFMSKN